jgi:predicted dienelactone hydrolase
MYDPFEPGPFSVGVHATEAFDPARDRRFPCEIWSPEAAGTFPLIVYSHPSRSHRRAATFLCTHLASHGYVVAAMDHSESVAPELAPREGETVEQKNARWDAVIAGRVPDIRVLLDHLHAEQAGIVGHSFGGWTALAAPEVEPRIAAVVALAPGGSSQPKPGILPVTLTFAWGREVPTLVLAAENDASIPLAGVREVFERTPSPKQMVVLRRADHLHFMDNVEELHESVRNMTLSGDLSWLPKAMLPMSELCSGEQAHLFTRGLTLCHFDAVLKRREEARRFLAGDIEGELAARAVEVIRS